VTNQAVAASVGVSPVTISKWRGRFLAKRLDGLVDEPRQGSPRTVTEDAVEVVIANPVRVTWVSTTGQEKLSRQGQEVRAASAEPRAVGHVKRGECFPHPPTTVKGSRCRTIPKWQL
jgi:Winged helix-turn helix